MSDQIPDTHAPMTVVSSPRCNRGARESARYSGWYGYRTAFPWSERSAWTGTALLHDDAFAAGQRRVYQYGLTAMLVDGGKAAADNRCAALDGKPLPDFSSPLRVDTIGRHFVLAAQLSILH
ncbi:hypothetical protein [Paraburkholderia sediminicola]|uniref:hypothetical protein n=1 Tax=Paraburkholderia sediminicola TaxID=458836 RepID=UPI0038BA926B